GFGAAKLARRRENASSQQFGRPGAFFGASPHLCLRGGEESPAAEAATGWGGETPHRGGHPQASEGERTVTMSSATTAPTKHHKPDLNLSVSGARRAAERARNAARVAGDWANR